MVEITIRRATYEDAELLSLLSIQTFDESFGYTCSRQDMHQFINENFTAQKIATELKDKLDYYFIAFVEDHPTGYMRLKKDDITFPSTGIYNALELKRIYVAKPFQSKNIGSTLINYAISLASSLQFDSIFLGVWEHNYRAKALYEKLGFKDTGYSHPFFIGNVGSIDNWYLKKL